MEASLAVVQIGITLAGAIAAAIGGAQADESIAPVIGAAFNLPEGLAEGLAIVFVVIPLSAVIIILGELVPKSLAIKNSEKVTLALSPMMAVLANLFYPAVVVFEWITKAIVSLFEKRMKKDISKGDIGLAELRAQTKVLRTGRVLSQQQEQMILGASNFTNTKLTAILVPAKEIVTLPAEGKLTEHLVTIHLEGYTRFPVTEVKGDPQRIIGYVTIKELLFLAKNHPGNPNIREILRPVLSLGAGLSIGEAFSAMMREHVHLALVRDAAGVTLGMVTLEDILEEVVGDIQDEFDRLPKYLTSSGNQYIVGGGVLLSAFFAKLGKPELMTAENANLTFSAWVKQHHLLKITGGDLIYVDHIKVLVRKVRRNLILEALVTLVTDQPEENKGEK
jgi:putative hemolysin